MEHLNSLLKKWKSKNKRNEKQKAKNSLLKQEENSMN